MYHSLSLMVVGKTNDVQISCTNSPTRMREIRYLPSYIDESFLRFQRQVENNASIYSPQCLNDTLTGEFRAKLVIFSQITKENMFFLSFFGQLYIKTCFPPLFLLLNHIFCKIFIIGAIRMVSSEETTQLSE